MEGSPCNFTTCPHSVNTRLLFSLHIKLRFLFWLKDKEIILYHQVRRQNTYQEIIHWMKQDFCFALFFILFLFLHIFIFRYILPLWLITHIW
jgi:hypothetical protein